MATLKCQSNHWLEVLNCNHKKKKKHVPNKYYGNYMYMYTGWNQVGGKLFWGMRCTIKRTIKVLRLLNFGWPMTTSAYSLTPHTHSSCVGQFLPTKNLRLLGDNRQGHTLCSMLVTCEWLEVVTAWPHVVILSSHALTRLSSETHTGKNYRDYRQPIHAYIYITTFKTSPAVSVEISQLLLWTRASSQNVGMVSSYQVKLSRKKTFHITSCTCLAFCSICTLP